MWVTSSGQSIRWADEPADRARAVAAVRTGLEMQKWLEAGKHYCGSGLAEGPPSFAGYIAAKRFLLKNGQQQAARRLACAVAGGAAIGERRARNSKCPDCGALETAWHRYYGCTQRQAPEDPFLAQWLSKTAFLGKKTKGSELQP